MTSSRYLDAISLIVGDSLNNVSVSSQPKNNVPGKKLIILTEETGQEKLNLINLSQYDYVIATAKFNLCLEEYKHVNFIPSVFFIPEVIQGKVNRGSLGSKTREKSNGPRDRIGYLTSNSPAFNRQVIQEARSKNLKVLAIPSIKGKEHLLSSFLELCQYVAIENLPESIPIAVYYAYIYGAIPWVKTMHSLLNPKTVVTGGGSQVDLTEPLFKNLSPKLEEFKKYLGQVSSDLSKPDPFVSFIKEINTKLTKIPATESLFQQILSNSKLEGLYLEFGVGASTQKIASLLGNRILYSFDWFQGLPEAWRPGYPEGCFSQKGVVPALPENVIPIIGRYESTLPQFGYDVLGSTTIAFR